MRCQYWTEVLYSLIHAVCVGRRGTPSKRYLWAEYHMRPLRRGCAANSRSTAPSSAYA